ncbi:MAG: kynureninase [Anaerolineales bacterium]|nr:kynureninase [Anaerolineales bacterium]
MKNFSSKFSTARDLDRRDPLRSFRDRFVIDDPQLIYLDGNSLGRLPKSTAGHLDKAVKEEWGKRLIRGWNEGWFELPQKLGAKIARIIGARPDEVLVCDSTSINLFKLTAAALRARPELKSIISDSMNFPSDLYIFQGVVDLLGDHHQLQLIPSKDGLTINTSLLQSTIQAKPTLTALTHVSFKSGFMYDMKKITRLVHQAGGVSLWDLSHSAGAVPLQLNRWEVDLAVGCTYKYLNGGPGSPAFLYVRKDLQEELIPPLWGWIGTKNPFEFNLDFEPAEGINRFNVSTPQVLSMQGIDPALDIILEAGIDRIREKSTQQTSYLLFLFQEWLEPLGCQLGSPLDPEQRGSQVSIRHPEAYRICQALINPVPAENQPRVIPDFRTPDNIRLGIAPLYTSYSDIFRALKRMRSIISQKTYTSFPLKRQQVT